MEIKHSLERKSELKHRFIEVEGVKTHLVEAGSGGPLVLIDGWYGTWDAFCDLIPQVSPYSKVFALAFLNQVSVKY